MAETGQQVEVGWRSFGAVWRSGAQAMRPGLFAGRRVLGSAIARDAAWSFGLKIVYTGLSFLVTVFLARLLGAEGYGIYSYSFALVTLLALPAQAGLPILMVRETARGMAQGRPELVQGIWRWAGRFTGLLSVALAVLLGPLILLWRGGLGTMEGLTMAWALLLVPLVALGNLRGAALRGLQKVVAGQVPEFVLRPGLLLVLVGVLALAARTQLAASQAMAAHVLAAALAFAAGAWLLWRGTPVAVRRAHPYREGQAWLASMMPLALLAGMQVINQQASILILGLFGPADQVGIYRVAVQMAMLASFALDPINVVVAPRFARLHARGEIAALQRLATASARLVLGLNLVATVGFVLLAEPFLGLVFGSAYVAAYAPLLILLVGQFVNSAVGPVGFLLNMTGHERDSARAVAIAAAVNGALNLLLVPIWGSNGAAMAAAVSVIASNALLCWAVRKRLGINTLAFGPSVARVP